MSAWHREHPELVGTDADPWMIHDDYRRALHHHRDLSGVSSAHVPGTPAGRVIPPKGTPAGTTDTDGDCDVCGAPVGKHHLSYCDLRGDA